MRKKRSPFYRRKMAGKKKSGVRAKQDKDQIQVLDETQLSSELMTKEPVIVRHRGRPRIFQCSDSKAPSCDDQRADPDIENNKDDESNSSRSQDGEKSVTNIQENVKHFTQMLQQGMSNIEAVVAKCNELQNENHELRKKLETSLVKLEEYESVKLLLSESIQSFNVNFVSSLTKATESLLGLSPKPPEAPKPNQTKNTRKAAGDGVEAVPMATRRKI